MIWRRKRTRPSRDAVETRRKLEQAKEDLAAAKADLEKVDQVAALQERVLHRNHFGPMISELIRRHAQ